MSDQLFSSIAQYGYFAILALIFLQEVGLPSPIPNEFVLIFSGYLSFTGIIKFPLVIFSAIVGDLLGSATLFILFYFFGKIIIQQKPKWITVSQKKIEHLSQKISISGQSGIFIGRLTPFIKGYVSVMCGLLRISPGKYGITLIFTSIIWVMVYVCCGYFAGPYWNLITQTDSRLRLLLFIIPVSIVLVIILFQVFKRLFSITKQLQIKQK